MTSILTPEQARLSVDEKLHLIGLLWDSLPEDLVPVPDWHMRLLEERMAEFEKNPSESQSWEVVKAELEREP